MLIAGNEHYNPLKTGESIVEWKKAGTEKVSTEKSESEIAEPHKPKGFAKAPVIVIMLILAIMLTASIISCVNLDNKIAVATKTITDLRETEIPNTYTKGRNDGYDEGYNAGSDEAYSNGYMDGFEEGKEVGRAGGYKCGYILGQSSNAQELYFYREHACVVTTAGEKYHRWDCYHISGREFYIYNIEKAEVLGYEPCLDCWDE